MENKNQIQQNTIEAVISLKNWNMKNATETEKNIINCYLHARLISWKNNVSKFLLYFSINEFPILINLIQRFWRVEQSL